MDEFGKVECEFCSCEYRWVFVTGEKASAPCEKCVAPYWKIYDATPPESKEAIKVTVPLTATAMAAEEATAWAAPIDLADRASSAARVGRCWHCYQPTAEKDKTPTNLPMCVSCHGAWTAPLVSPGLLEKMSAIVATGSKM